MNIYSTHLLNLEIKFFFTSERSPAAKKAAKKARQRRACLDKLSSSSPQKSPVWVHNTQCIFVLHYSLFWNSAFTAAGQKTCLPYEKASLLTYPSISKYPDVATQVYLKWLDFKYFRYKCIFIYAVSFQFQKITYIHICFF